MEKTPSTETKILPSVSSYIDAFGLAMFDELAANQDKGDWREWKDITEIWKEFSYHKGKLSKAIMDQDRTKIKEHIADTANYLLMLGNAYDLYNK